MTEVVQGTPEPKRMVKVFRLKAVEEWCGLKASRIWDLVKSGEFPQPINLTSEGYAIGWLEDELAAWLDRRKHSPRRLPLKQRLTQQKKTKSKRTKAA